MLHGKRVLLIVSGGIAAYKSLELVRRLRERGAAVRCVLTRGGAQFVTPLSLSALSEDKVYTDLFSLTDEAEMGHIQLSRDADLLLVVPASADILAKMAQGLADDLATTALLATDKDVIVAPAMNVRMWNHPATQANLAHPCASAVCISWGPSKAIWPAASSGRGAWRNRTRSPTRFRIFFSSSAPLSGRRALVTSGPTHEPIDPVRYIANRSSGRQGHAIAAALARRGARTTLVSGPTHLPDPAGVEVVRVESARDMLAACETSLPADVAVCAAAVADWRVAREAEEKLKKNGAGAPTLEMAENPDILATLSATANTRPGLVIGFAAETENVIEHATAKRTRKGCDWILANDVSPETGTFGGTDNTIHLVSGDGVEDWPRMSKTDVADRLADRIVAQLAAGT